MDVEVDVKGTSENTELHLELHRSVEQEASVSYVHPKNLQGGCYRVHNERIQTGCKKRDAHQTVFRFSEPKPFLARRAGTVANLVILRAPRCKEAVTKVKPYLSSRRDSLIFNIFYVA